ncbi:MAG: hypothetical protein H8E44_20425 [Planctomycetes bacterium]|nr:hypothetical protein [Planctomycetota bacterium]MBL7037749.1 hypothetical protein [Pirellulaceae bacterium]
MADSGMHSPHVTPAIASGFGLNERTRRALSLPDTDDPQELIARMAANPQIIERPIVVYGRKARLGRPPEDVLGIV